MSKNQLHRFELKQVMVVTLLLVFSITSSFGVEPDEILSNNRLEKRAREISSELRCLVCRNENIDSSNADLAKDLRVLVRERLRLGESNDEVLEYVHARYGDFILLKPKFSGTAIVLWLIAPLSFIFGILLIFLMFFRKQKNNSHDNLTDSLSKHEENIIEKLLRD